VFKEPRSFKEVRKPNVRPSEEPFTVSLWHVGGGLVIRMNEELCATGKDMDEVRQTVAPVVKTV
jgi:hypothetical protein